MNAEKTGAARHARTTSSRWFPFSFGWISVPLLAGVLSAVICVTTFICLWRLHSVRLSRWSTFLSVPIAACCFGVMVSVVGRRRHQGMHGQQELTVLVIFAITLLGVIRVLFPVSRSAGRKEIWAQPMIVVGGILLLFLVINLFAWLRDPRILPLERHSWPSRLILGTFFLILGAVAYSSLPGRAVVLPSQPRPVSSPTVLFAVGAIGMLAVLVTRAEWAAKADAAIVPDLLPIVIAVGFFGLTRDLGVAVALFCASIAVLMSGTRGLLVGPAKDGSPKAQNWLVPTLLSFVFFAVGVSFVIASGSKLLGIPQFGFRDALGFSDRQPAPFLVGENLIKGPGLDPWFAYLWHGKTSTAPEVLAMIGHEAGLPCLVGLIIVFALLFFSLARLAMQVRERTRAALAWGLIVFLAIQCLLAMETLIPVGVPIGEGPPLLAGGWADYLADLIAIGTVIGLSRQACQPIAAAKPVQTRLQQSQATTRA